MAVEFEQNNKDRLPYLHYLELFAQKNPNEISEKCNVKYNAETKQFNIGLMGERYNVSYPEFNVTHLTGGYAALELINARILILRYFVDGCFAAASGRFLSYRDVPWGEVYYQNFKSRCLGRFAFTYAKKTETLEKSMQKLNAKKLDGCDAGYEFEFMDGLSLRFMLWQADEEFMPSAQILFSDNFALAFTAEDMAVVGDISIGALGKI
ncbi:MAG: DUF3786 domain-containing protein [Oscillospiraceae bacterium]